MKKHCSSAPLLTQILSSVQESIERDLAKLGNVLKMRERSMLYGMKLETKLGRLNQMLEVSCRSLRVLPFIFSVKGISL